jgi:hypothetical protein
LKLRGHNGVLRSTLRQFGSRVIVCGSLFPPSFPFDPGLELALIYDDDEHLLAFPARRGANGQQPLNRRRAKPLVGVGAKAPVALRCVQIRL